MICTLCYWCGKHNRTVGCSTSKFVQGGKNYQKSSLKGHNLSAPYDLTRKSKENFDAQKASLSIRPRKVVQASPIAKSVHFTANKWQRSSNSDKTTWHSILHRPTWTSIHTIWTTSKIRKTPCYYHWCKWKWICMSKFYHRHSRVFFSGRCQKKIEVVTFIAILCVGSKHAKAIQTPKKNPRKLKSVYQELKVQYGCKPLNGGETRWIEH